MSILTKKEREFSVKQVLASEAIEGFQPGLEFKALLARYESGELTMAQIDKIITAKYLPRPVDQAA